MAALVKAHTDSPLSEAAYYDHPTPDWDEFFSQEGHKNEISGTVVSPVSFATGVLSSQSAVVAPIYAEKQQTTEVGELNILNLVHVAEEADVGGPESYETHHGSKLTVIGMEMRVPSPPRHTETGLTEAERTEDSFPTLKGRFLLCGHEDGPRACDIMAWRFNGPFEPEITTANIPRGCSEDGAEYRQMLNQVK
ncbi:hypothetical protein BJX65DRAFT_302893 [Aspergillus insuetus]